SEKEHDRPLRGKRGHPLDPRIVQTVAGGQRVQLAGDIESERKSQDLVRSKALANGGGRVALEDAEVLLENFPERPIRDPLSVREAAARATHGLRRLGAEPVRSPTRISPGAAACSSRAAQLTASPVTNALPSRGRPTTTSPVFTPMRSASSSPNSARRRRCIASAACNARSAWSSSAAGA